MKLSELQGVSPLEEDMPVKSASIPVQPKSGGLLGEGFAGELPQLLGSLLSLPMKTTLPGMLTSGVGGAGGEAFKQIGQHYTGSELAPSTSMDAAKRIGEAFIEEAAFEGLGRGVASGFSKLGEKIKPKIKEGFEDYEKSFEKFGGRLSATQRIEHQNLASWSMVTLDSLSRGSITAKGIFKNFDEANERSLRWMADQILTDISGSAKKTLSDHQLGRLFIEAVDSGSAAHSVVAGKYYSAVDNAASKLRGQNAGGIVDTAKLKDVATKWREKYKRIGDVGKGKIASTELDKILNIGDDLTFEDAHFLRAALLGKQRELKLKGETGVSTKIISDLVDSVNKVMDDAGSVGNLGSAYDKARKFYKFGANNFNDKFMTKLMTTAPERIGETVFRSGNVEQVIRARQTLKKASLIDKSVNFNETWRKIQEGYMSSILSGPLVDELGTPIGKKILKLFENKKQFRTMNAAFSKPQINSLKEFARIAETVQAKPEANLGMVMSLAQGGAVIGVVSGVLTEAAVPLFLGPPVIAKLLTNPKTSKAMIDAMTTPLTNRKATTIITKLVGALSEDELKNAVEAQPGQSEQSMQSGGLKLSDIMEQQ